MRGVKEPLEVGRVDVRVVVELADERRVLQLGSRVQQPASEREHWPAHATLVVRDGRDEEHVAVHARLASQCLRSAARRTARAYHEAGAHCRTLVMADVWPAHPAVPLRAAPVVVARRREDAQREQKLALRTEPGRDWLGHLTNAVRRSAQAVPFPWAWLDMTLWTL
jgi:hypothetical protein